MWAFITFDPMQKKHTFLVLLMLLTVSTVEAQLATLKGYMVDDVGVRLTGVTIQSTDKTIQTVVDLSGKFSIELESNRDYELVFSFATNKKILKVHLLNGEVRNLGAVVMESLQSSDVVVEGKTPDLEDPTIVKIPPFDISGFALPNGVTQALAYITPAVSNNELTANYNVRGGNYDENLIYVNGFEIYRPFLTRAGQQEGMNFINSAMVDDISFSAGGFDAKYGDRLSSVLDIKYRNPEATKASVVAGLLGAEAHAEGRKNRFSYLAGARFRSNGYLLNTLPTQGEYNPVFWDGQLLLGYDINEKLRWNILGHFSSNKFNFVPQTRQTSFGTFNQALSFNVYFQGQEVTAFQTITGATSLEYQVSRSTKLSFFASVFNTNETESFDVLGQYYINELENDPAKETFGDSVNTLGVGSFLNHSRNRLNATIVQVYHTGEKLFKTNEKTKNNKLTQRNSRLDWGTNFQRDYFNDVISEWVMVDSAGYVTPQNQGGALELQDVIKQKHVLQTYRLTGNVTYSFRWNFVKEKHIVKLKDVQRDDDNKKVKRHFNDTLERIPARLALNMGVRTGFTGVNQEAWLTPRVSLVYTPRLYFYRDGKVYRRNMKLRLASGLYYQPPLYRDLRGYYGELNLDVLAQKSFHVVAGTDIFFNMWNRESPFKFSAEVYYKYLWDVNPYKISDVRLRYLANNDAVAYAYGADLNLNGQFIKGVESFFKIGFLRTMENLKNDDYYMYFNAAGDTIYPGYTFDQVPVDSLMQSPGYIPRPSDQMITFGALFQDRMPKFEQISVQLSTLFGSRLPYGPPGPERYKDTLRQKAYMRVDIGISYDFLYKKPVESRKNFWRKFSDIKLSFEVFNLLGINNVLSQTWVQDVEGRYYAIPNYLTQRLFNLKLILRL
mgnify:CR=1 FL=1